MSPGGRQPRLTAQLLRAWRHSVARAEWQVLGPAALQQACAQQIRFGLCRRSAQILLRVFSPPLAAGQIGQAYSVVELVVDDMPFLVDTLTLTLAQADIAVQLTLHPILRATRDARGTLRALDSLRGASGGRPESWQRLHIDRVADAQECEALRRRLLAALRDVRRACRDWKPMRRTALALSSEMEQRPPPVAAEVISESAALLRYMEDNHFTFLGYRESRLRHGRGGPQLIPIAGSMLGVLRARPRPARDARVPVANIRRVLRSSEVVIITKANLRSTVHRAGYLDYVGVKRFDARGRVIGEARFVGLWTSSTYSADVRTVPWLRHKFARVVAAFPFAASSHDGKRLVQILETLPRDELFQASVADLARCARIVLALQERQRVRLILRRDEFRRFWSCLIYLPRERCSTEIRQSVEALMKAALHGTQMDSSLTMSDAPLAQLHLVVRSPPDARQHLSVQQLESQIAATLVLWRDRLRAALLARFPDALALALERRYAATFPASYQQDVDAATAVEDIGDLEALALARSSHAMRLRLYRPARQRPTRVHLRIIRRDEPLSVSEVMPTFEHFGLRVIAERPYELGATAEAWIQDFELEHESSQRVDVARVGGELALAFFAVRAGEIDDDGFNRLLISAALSVRQVTVLRACCRYLLQTGIAFSQSYMERVLSTHANVARDLWQLFEQRLRPGGGAAAQRSIKLVQKRIQRALEHVRSPDEDRILRAFLAVILATLRTNYFRAGAGRSSALALKFDPQSIPGLPQPRPAFEIFVHSPAVEGVHLRKGPIARGGIRWSERAEDFRTEVLGLMKAQHVKNTLIIPVGAKGGFVARRLRAADGRDAQQREIIACYQTFIRALLDLTDNLVAGKVVPPKDVARLDADDPYLVVAADKGTASFSDLANAISADYHFWLGDAFASGGSDGYDHKKMGITARGAWECIKRHFRELGRDIQRQPFTVIGIGDMSGDVFGNGMLLSRHIRLVAAFNHKHIFIDPDPAAAASLRERRRLYRLPRSGWNDYNRKLISAGGGVFERDTKNIPLSPQMQRLLGLQQARASSQEIIRAILCLPVDLLWNGGIGTYVKASSERHSEIGDRANDAVRIDGRQLRALVVGEGGNLGLSQRGRIEYALAGGRVNADFIDNSAGVNTSDVEVNLKILLDAPNASEPVTRVRRNRLLAACTGDVAELVLRNNYLQSQTISLMEARAVADLSEHQQLLRWLERHGELDRAVEQLPTDDEIDERRRLGRGLTRPELALLLAYGKIALNHALSQSQIGADPYLSRELERYFPPQLRSRFPRRIAHHRLRRQIIATATTNSIAHRMGPGLLMQLSDASGADAGGIASAYTIARDAGDLRTLWAELEGLDGRIKATDQYQGMLASSAYLLHLTTWLLAHRRDYADVGAAVATLQPALRECAHVVPSMLRGLDREQYDAERARQLATGMPLKLAERLAALLPMRMALDLTELMRSSGRSCRTVAGYHFELAAELGLDWLYRAIAQLPALTGWQGAARARLQAVCVDAHRRLTAAVLRPRRHGDGPPPTSTAAANSPAQALARWRETLRSVHTLAAPDLAALTVAAEALENLAGHRPAAIARLL